LTWLKALHLIFMVTWFAGLFYLPRLYVYHAMSTDQVSIDRFKLMEHNLFFGIMTPGGLLTVIFGLWLLAAGWETYRDAGWLHAKLLLIGILIGYHVYCGKLLLDFKRERNRHSHKFYRWINEFPVLILISVVILAVIRPF
jgi:putative membrane protein